MVDFQSRDSRRHTKRRNSESEDSTGATSPDPDEPVTDNATGTRSDDGPDAGPDSGPVGAAVVTVSDDRTAETDPGGEAVAEALESGSYEVRTREILRPNHDSVQQALDTLIKRDDVDVVVTTGGTGIAPKDVTPEAVRPLIDRALPGFGEQFRRRYADAVGSDAIATRATAGIADATPLFCLPGNPEGARIGTGELIVEQAARLVQFANSDDLADP